MEVSETKKMKALEAENYRLRPAVSDLTLDKMIKTDAACGHGAPHQLLNQLTTLVRYAGRVEIFNFGYKFGSSVSSWRISSRGQREVVLFFRPVCSLAKMDQVFI